MLNERQAGVLCHPTSFPGAYGMGEIGAAARDFVDAIAAADQAWWQVLPLNPTGNGASPYSATSSFAGNPLMIDLDDLVEQDLLSRKEIETLTMLPNDRVAFDRAIPARELALDLAADRLARKRKGQAADELDAFIAANTDWLDDFALWEALSRTHARAHWNSWPEELRRRDKHALGSAKRALRAEIAGAMALQYLFDSQWRRVRQHGARRGVRIIGDMPIFVSDNSADVWAKPHLFKLDTNLRSTVVAGVPPDYFSVDGQLWGNPLYDWDAMRADGFAWWIARMRRLMQTTDLVRIDHFRGFAACWEVPAGAPTAATGAWAPAPGAELFAAFQKEFPHMPVIAEDLGHITDDVYHLRDQFGMPGLKIVQFSFGAGPPTGPDHPENYPANSVAYPGTHDNNTMLGWLRNDSLDASNRAADAAREAANALATVGGDETEFARRINGLTLRSGSNLAIIALQDVMGLDGRARMNTPGTVGGRNWAWRYRTGELTDDMLAALAAATRAGKRSPGRAWELG